MSSQATAAEQLSPQPPVTWEHVAVDPSGARAGVLHTRRGSIETPVFMPVGTHALIGNLAGEEVAPTGAKIILANTYHLLLRPGPEVFEHMGGIHPFMKWDGAVLTDSGGFQIFSLKHDVEISEKGARFRSFRDSRMHLLTPESSIGMQQSINSDIMMVLDVCIDSTSDEKTTREAMERTHRWALRSLKARSTGEAARATSQTGQALFGIVQGGVFPALRDESAAFLTSHPFDGFAIGGLAVGETKTELTEMTARVTAHLPKDKPRYLMGVGTPTDLVEAVYRGVDMFDCIIPTKMAQQCFAYTFDGQLRMSKLAHRLDKGPLDAACSCHVCRTYSRAYLHHLLRDKHRLGVRLLSIHNIAHYQQLMRRMRAAIVEGRFEAERKALLDGYNRKRES